MKGLVLSLMLVFSSLAFANNNAVKIARYNGVRGNILKANIVRDRGGERLFAVSNYGAYLFKKNGNRYDRKFVFLFKKKANVINQAGFVDINRDGYYEFYFAYKINNSIKLHVYNYKGINRKPIMYIVTNNNGSIRKSTSLISVQVIYSWMKNKVIEIANNSRGNHYPKPIDQNRLNPNNFRPLCSINYKNNKCSIAAKNINNKIVFQVIRGDGAIKVQKKFPNGVYMHVYSGQAKTIDMPNNKLAITTIIVSLLNKDRNSKIRIFTMENSQSNSYQRQVILPDRQAAEMILRRKYNLYQNEIIHNIYIYEENSKATILAITNKAVYKIIDSRGDWKGFIKFEIGMNNKIDNQNIIFTDINNDNQKDLFFSSSELNSKNKANTLLFNNKQYIYYGALATKINQNINYRFYNNPPMNIKLWLKNIMSRRRIINIDNSYNNNNNIVRGRNITNSIREWISNNNFLHKNEYKNLRLTYYPGNNDMTFSRYFNISPVISKVVDSQVVYKAHYRGLLTAYDSSKNYSYIVWIPKNNTTFITSMYNYNNFIIMTLSKNGIIVLNKKKLTLKHISLNELENNNAWSIRLIRNIFYILTNNGEIKINKYRILNQNNPMPLNKVMKN